MDLNILKDYSKWKEANPDNWNILNYVNYFYDDNAALALSKFYFPDISVHDGCYLIDFLFDKEMYAQWNTALNGNKTEIEKMCNLYEVKDFFHINSESNEEKIEALGNTILTSWQLWVKNLFPEENLHVELFTEMESLFITLYNKK